MPSASLLSDEPGLGPPAFETVLRELLWYLPLGASWRDQAQSNTSLLICRWDRAGMVGVSIAYLGRSLAHAEERASVCPYPLCSFRRGVATMHRDRGAEWEGIRDTLRHRSIGTTEGCVRSLEAAR